MPHHSHWSAVQTAADGRCASAKAGSIWNSESLWSGHTTESGNHPSRQEAVVRYRIFTKNVYVGNCTHNDCTERCMLGRQRLGGPCCDTRPEPKQHVHCCDTQSRCTRLDLGESVCLQLAKGRANPALATWSARQCTSLLDGKNDVLVDKRHVCMVHAVQVLTDD